jgi:hypothetical protein
MKPKNKLVQLDYVLDDQSNFHSKDNEKKITENWTTTNENIHSIDRLTLSSTNLTLGENYKRFAVGILTSNGIQLSPLNAIFQLRPNFDATASNLAQQSTTIDDEDIESESVFPKHSNSNTEETTTDEETNDKTSNELVTMKFWRPEGRLQREKKMRSYNYFERARHEERWIDFAYYSPNESPSIELRNQWIMKDNIERNRWPIRWRKTVSIQDYFQLLFFDKEILLEKPVENEKVSIETNVPTEQKPLIIPPTKPKKKKKNDSEKTTATTTKKTTSRKSKEHRTIFCFHIDFIGRSITQKSTDSPINPEQAQTNTPLSSVTLPKTIIKQDPETIQNELLSFIKRRFGYRPYFKLSEINIGRYKLTIGSLIIGFGIF